MGGSEQGAADDGLRRRGSDGDRGARGEKSCDGTEQVAPSTAFIAAIDIGKPHLLLVQFSEPSPSVGWFV